MGALVAIDNILSGDPSMSILEKWICEYQEQVSLLINVKDINILKKIAERENCPVSILGYINDSERIQVYDAKSDSFPVDLALKDVLGNIPQKEYILEESYNQLIPLELPTDINLMNALDRVLRLVSVGSKRFLTNKVDRSVTGLIAQQQCVGPLHTPLANVAITAQSHSSLQGAAIAIGEQPIKGLIDIKAMVNMSIGEMLTNLVWAGISNFGDIKCSGNWMWPGKDPIEGYQLYIAVKEVAKTLLDLGIAIDGGKDSMSMKVESSKRVIKSPRSLVMSGYAPCPNIMKKVTPDLKSDDSYLFFIDLNNKFRMGGSALAQVFKQIGDTSPNMDYPVTLKRIFNGNTRYDRY